MPTGAITGYIDVAQLVLYAFWIFFAGLIVYLHRENKREGYPLESGRTDRTERIQIQGFPAMPAPKTFTLPHGGTVQAPSGKRDTRSIKAQPIAGFPGAPLEPTGNPMTDGVGPAAYAERADAPDVTVDGVQRIVPLRVATDHALDSRDPDLLGKPVLGADGEIGGTVMDVWVDRSDILIRYLEVQVSPGGRRVLLPMTFARVTPGAVLVKAVLGRHFADVPALKNPDQVTLLEEDMICGYYGGGTLYAEPRRQEPLL
ncbi:MAG: photosynthetic reaction center subunit H [Pseudomonadota bacterium]